MVFITLTKSENRENITINVDKICTISNTHVYNHGKWAKDDHAVISLTNENDIEVLESPEEIRIKINKAGGSVYR